MSTASSTYGRVTLLMVGGGKVTQEGEGVTLEFRGQAGTVNVRAEGKEEVIEQWDHVKELSTSGAVLLLH